MHNTNSGTPLRYVGGIILGAYALHSLASLAHEVVWIKLLSATFGASVLAVAVVMAVFVSGIALGSWAIARMPAGSTLTRFGVLQAVLGAWAVLLPFLVRVIDQVYTVWAPPVESWLHTLLRLLAVAALILVPSSLIGAVFPLLSQVSPRLAREQAQGPGRLYLIGLLFSAAGAVVAPVALIPQLGVTASSWVVGGLNLLLAALAFAATRWLDVRAVPAKEDVEAKPNDLPLGHLCIVAFIQGSALFALELVGAKVLWLTVDTTAYTEGILFAVVLAAMTVGSLLTFALRRLRVRPVSLLVSSLLLTALCQTVMIPSARLLAFGFGNAVYGTRWVTASLGGFCIAEALLALAQLGLPVLFSGMAFTCLCEVVVGQRSNFTSPVGRLYAWSNAGAVVGSLGATLVLVPALGLTWSLTTISLLLLVAGVATAIRLELAGVKMRWAYGWGTVVATLVVVSGATGDITYRSLAAGPQHAVIFHHEDGIGIVEVLENVQDKSRILRSSHVRQEGGTQPVHLRTQHIQGQLPIWLHPQPERILVIGLGTGISLGGLLWDGARDVSCVEISRGVIGAQQYFRPFSGDLLRSGKFRLIHQDGRDFIRLTRDRYDLILQDVFFPYQAGVSNLYSVEHYQRCRDKLAPGGCAAQWVCINQVAADDLKTLVATFASVFPHTSLWRDEIYLLLWGNPEPLSLDLARFGERGTTRRVGRRGPASELPLGPADLLTRFVCDEQAVTRWTAGVELNTEDNLLIECRTPLHLGELNSAELAVRNLRALESILQPVSMVCRAADSDEAQLLDRVAQAAKLYLSGTVAVIEDNLGGARRDLKAALALRPSDVTARDWFVDDAIQSVVRMFRAGDLQGALNVLDETAEVAPSDPRILITQAGILARQQQWQVAADKCRLLLDRDPKFTPARVILGSIQVETGQLNDAEATFRHGLEDAPNDRELQSWLQRCLERRRQDRPIDSQGIRLRNAH